jgi:hypothetical protein
MICKIFMKSCKSYENCKKLCLIKYLWKVMKVMKVMIDKIFIKSYENCKKLWLIKYL